jgi:hypothetical protein
MHIIAQGAHAKGGSCISSGHGLRAERHERACGGMPAAAAAGLVGLVLGLKHACVQVVVSVGVGGSVVSGVKEKL